MLTVGVTGTNGKTTTTSLVAECLRAVSPSVVRVTTLGAHLDGAKIEVPSGFEGLLAAVERSRERGGTACAIEYTSEALSAGVARYFPADVGVFTNLTHDHLDAHGSLEHYLASKAQLFVTLKEGGAAVLNGCDENAALIDEVVPEGRRKILFGLSSRGEPWRALDLAATNVGFDWSGTTIDLAPNDLVRNACTLHIRAIGSIFAENALAALGAALAAGVPFDRAIERLSACAPPPGRFERVADANVVVDYAHSPDALARTIATARALTSKKVVVVFGAGGNRDRAKRPLLGEAASAADRIVLTSDNARDEDPGAIAAAIRGGIRGSADVVLELDRAKAIERAIREANEDDVVVIAGKGHESVQTEGGRSRAFSDRDVASATLAKLGRGKVPRDAAH